MRRQVLGLGVTVLLVNGIMSSCGHEETSQLNRVEAIEGSLYVIPDGEVTGGQVKYMIYKNGMITYMGDVSYNVNVGDLINIEVLYVEQVFTYPRGLGSGFIGHDRLPKCRS